MATVNPIMMDDGQVLVFGGSGYAGLELLRWLTRHPLRLRGVSSLRWVDRPVRDVVPVARTGWRFISHADLLRRAEANDVALLATPAETSLQLTPALLARGVAVVDLSGAFRLEANQYPDWYGFEHPEPALLAEAKYGMVDLFPWSQAPRLVANPGCYATAAILSLAPLLQAGVIDGPIMADGKSGTTGAGRKAEERLLFSEVSENLSAYRVGHHQHTPEIEMALARYSGRPIRVHFVPHLVPMQRGLLVTSYARSSSVEGAPNQVLRSAFEASSTVQVVDAAPGTGPVRGTPFVRLHAQRDARTGTVTAFGALDNLVKGAAGQAIENLNLLKGLPRGTGLVRNQERSP
ncbi:MAG: N-acetyl-gamma-glutamyl-phosphate reductase [Myxococcota bacterium]